MLLASALLIGFLADANAQTTRVELHTWFSPSRGDYFTTSHPPWVRTPGQQKDGYTHIRVEDRDDAWIDPPSEPITPSYFGRADTAQWGRRPLLVIVMDFSDQTVPQGSFHEIQALFAGSTYPNVGDYFRENSYGWFEWSPIIVLRVQFSWSPSTSTSNWE